MSKKYNNFQQIPQLTRSGSYQVNVNWKYLENWIKRQEEEMNLQLEPVFQRGHVWTREQQIAYVEFVLRGGRSSRVIYFNCPSWHIDVRDGEYNDFVCVDGLQRLTAVRKFMNNEIPAFGTYYKDFTGRFPTDADLLINVNDLQTENEVLQWYIDLNTGGTPHSKEEIQRVKNMLAYKSDEIARIADQIAPGKTVYWVQWTEHKIIECKVTSVEYAYNTIQAFKVKLPRNDKELFFGGDVIGDLIFVDEESAKKRYYELVEES